MVNMEPRMRSSSLSAWCGRGSCFRNYIKFKNSFVICQELYFPPNIFVRPQHMKMPKMKVNGSSGANGQVQMPAGTVTYS